MINAPNSQNNTPDDRRLQWLAAITAGIAVPTLATLAYLLQSGTFNESALATKPDPGNGTANAKDGSSKKQSGKTKESTEKHEEMELTQEAVRNILQKLGYDVDGIMEKMRADPATKDTAIAWTYNYTHLQQLLDERIRNADPTHVMAHLTVEVRRVDDKPTLALMLHQHETSEPGEGLIKLEVIERVLPDSPPMSLTQSFGLLHPKQFSETKTNWKRQQMFLQALKKIPRKESKEEGVIKGYPDGKFRP
jgi:hypothetical protein